MRVTPWICSPPDFEDGSDEGYFCYRAIEGKDHEHVAFRVAAIEKTPRVRIAKFADDLAEESRNWDEGPRGRGGCGAGTTCAAEQTYGSDPASREWCDARLRELGYILPEDD